MEIDGRQVRRLVVTWLMDARGSPLTVPELVGRLAARGFVLQGRGGKVVSDSLRWEVRRGRVHRVRRSTYVIGSVPRTTALRIRREARTLLGSRGDRPALSGADIDRLADRALDDLLRARRSTT